MTLYYLESLTPVQSMPRRPTFNLITSRLTSAEFIAAVGHINALIAGDEIHTSSWMPGDNWAGTALQPIHDKAARSNYDLSAQMFGLLVFHAFMLHPDDWITGRFEKDGEPLRGRTYFRKRY